MDNWQLTQIACTVVLGLVSALNPVNSSVNKNNPERQKNLSILISCFSIPAVLILGLALYNNFSKSPQLPQLAPILNGFRISLTNYALNGVQIVATNHITLPATNHRSVIALNIVNSTDVPAKNLKVHVWLPEQLSTLTSPGWEKGTFSQIHQLQLIPVTGQNLWTFSDTPIFHEGFFCPALGVESTNLYQNAYFLFIDTEAENAKLTRTPVWLHFTDRIKEPYFGIPQ
jgi:hypothetical protein